MIKNWTIYFFTIVLLAGCQSVPNDKSDTKLNTDSEVESASDKKTPVSNKKWQLIQISGFDSQQSTYQKFTLTFNNESLSAKAFNTFAIPTVSLDKNGVLKQSGAAMTTKMAVIDQNKAALETAFFSKVSSAKLWRIQRKRLVLGSGKNRLIFIEIH